MAEPSICKEPIFESIYFDQAEDLRNFLYYKSGNLKQAEDWVQESFIRLWDNCAKVNLDKARSFLFTVGHNLFLNAVKHDKVVLKFQQQQTHKTSSQETPEYLLEEKEFQAKLQKAISDLSEPQRVVFLMNRIDKKTYKEIAETLGISVKAVEKRMHKALLALRTISKKI